MILYEDLVQNVMQEGWLGKTLDALGAWATQMAGRLILAVVFLVLGFKAVKLIMKLIKRTFEKHKTDRSVQGFLLSLFHVTGKLLVLITAATILGVQMTSFIAILSSAGIAVGLALQGSLSNLAGGVLILILKPFVVGDYILEKNTNQEGTVKSIDIFYTRLTTPDNKMIVVPNGALSATSIVNYSTNPTRRVELTVGVEYNTDIDYVKQALCEAVKRDSAVLTDEPIDIYIDKFDTSALVMGLRYFVPAGKYWESRFHVEEEILRTFKEYNIVIPYTKLDVHLEN